MADGAFYCHNTTIDTGEVDEDGEDEWDMNRALLCSGAIEWQEKNLGYPGQLARIAERLNSV